MKLTKLKWGESKLSICDVGEVGTQIYKIAHHSLRLQDLLDASDPQSHIYFYCADHQRLYVDFTAAQVTQISQLAAKFHVLTNYLQSLVVLLVLNNAACSFRLLELLIFLCRRILWEDLCSFVLRNQFLDLFDWLENSGLENGASVSYKTLDGLDAVIYLFYQTDMQL